jgi:SAM-dependent methyltransferase
MDSPEFVHALAFLGTELDARAISSAIELGIIDGLADEPATAAALAETRRVNPKGLALLLDMLEVNGVVARSGALVALTPEFRAALRYRDLLETTIEFADLVWPDIHALFTPLLNDPPRFLVQSAVFDLFRYDRCIEISPENIAATRRWTKFTTCLTTYEASAAFAAIDLSGVASFIDLGGNTGEFARQLCLRHPTVRATVVDLPVVCEIGRQHIAGAAEADEASRIDFFPTDLRGGPLPAAADLVSFKSVLHDWPDEEATSLLARAVSLVRPGGQLMIFERAPIATRGHRISYALAPFLAFLHYLRPADLYVRTLIDLGFEAVDHRVLALDTDFHLVTARRSRMSGR